MALTGSQVAYRQARAGIARAGASRANYFTPNTVLTINGVDRTFYVESGSIKITQNYNGTPWTCRFTLTPKIPVMPLPDEVVYVGLGTSVNREFGGQILRVTHRRLRGNQGSFLDVECTDFTRLLDAKLVTERFSYQSATDILRSCVAKYAPAFTTTNVVAGLPTIPDFPVTNERLSTVIRRLVEAMGGGGGYVDASRDVHLFATVGETGGRAPTPPQSITNTNLLSEVFSHRQDGSQKRTRDIVEGKRTRTLLGTPGSTSSVVVSGSAPVDFLVVGGGGAGETVRGGGGGGGRVLTGTVTLASGSYGITIGAGGVGANGSDTTFDVYVAPGGGRGGLFGAHAGGNGGSGGGGSGSSSAAGSAVAGTGVAGYGNAGGAGNAALNPAGGGGGGASAAGTAAGPNTGGKGGDGIASSISGTSQYYGGGGGGNGDTSSGNGGLGGGGKGGAGGSPGTAGTANTGGGGGGGGSYNGGSGIVILSYQTGLISATGGTITTVGDRTIHTFTTNGTFSVATVTLTSAPVAVTDVPVEDISVLDGAGGTLRIGQAITTYLSLMGPTVAEGDNPPGSTLSADAAAAATSLSVTSSTPFAAAPGWVKVGDQIVRYASVAAGALNGIPALGYGALAAPAKSGTQVTWIGAVQVHATGVTFDPPIEKGDDVVQRVIVDDAAAQAALAAVSGVGDGIREAIVQDGRLSVSGATTRGAGDLTAFKADLVEASWETRDMNARPGTMQVIDRTGADPFAATLIVTQVEVELSARGHWRPPLRRCTGGAIRRADVIDVVVTKQT